jgi:hypothetical protein
MAKNKPYNNYDMISYVESLVSDDKYLEALVIVSSYIETFLGEIVIGPFICKRKIQACLARE